MPEERQFALGPGSRRCSCDYNSPDGWSLGNQLWQWALGQAFEHRGQEVVYDTALFDHDPGRKYLLDKLGLELRLSHHGGTGIIIQEGSLRYKPELLDLQGDVTLIGYWQSEKYLAGIEDQIRKAILIPNRTIATVEMARTICDLKDRSCMVHIRRSDNLRPAGMEVHGLLSAPDCLYYDRAMMEIRKQVRGIRFFVFSDDPEWCKQNIQGPDITVVDSNRPSFTVDEKHDIYWQDGGTEAEDLYLMSLCRHAIIANSSFSWWAAWLGDVYPNRWVIAPEQWFASKALDPSDIIPERWTKMAIR